MKSKRLSCIGSLVTNPGIHLLGKSPIQVLTKQWLVLTKHKREQLCWSNTMHYYCYATPCYQPVGKHKQEKWTRQTSTKTWNKRGNHPTLRDVPNPHLNPNIWRLLWIPVQLQILPDPMMLNLVWIQIWPNFN